MDNLSTKVAQTQWGEIEYFEHDYFIGRSLAGYGWWSKGEIDLFEKLLNKDSVVIEAGSNIGALTIPLARMAKVVFAFEPQPENFYLLMSNAKRNNLDNIWARHTALGEKRGITTVPYLKEWSTITSGGIEIGHGHYPVAVECIDDFVEDLRIEKVDLIKIDVEGAEISVIKGAVKTIEKFRPILYFENDRKANSEELLKLVKSLGYRVRDHHPRFTEGSTSNLWDRDYASFNVLGIPEERPEISIGEDTPKSTIDCATDLVLDGKHHDALKIFEQVLESDPNNAEAKWRAGNAYLAIGEMEKAWSLMEARKDKLDHKKWGIREFDAPQWDGKPTDKTVLLWAEQGYGDIIQILRFINLIKAPIVVEVQAPLLRLCQQSYPDIKFIQAGSAFPRHDLQYPLLSFPHIFKVTLATLPNKVPYLKVDEDLITWFGYKIKEAIPQGPKLGLFWNGDSRHIRGFERSIPAEALNPLTDNYDFMSLQQEHNDFIDFAETAAIISNLDAVVTIDSAVAHLAGALGKPVITLLSTPCAERWMLKRNDSPWYPTMHLIRQTIEGSWAEPIQEALKLLQERYPVHLMPSKTLTTKDNRQIQFRLKNPDNRDQSQDVLRHIRYAHSLKLPELAKEKVPKVGRAIIVGGAPSVKDYLAQIKEFSKDPENTIFALNWAHTWLINNDIVPNACVFFEIDAEPDTILKSAHKDVTYYICSHCHEKTFDMLEGYKRVLWHSPPVTENETKIKNELFKDSPTCGGGGGTFTRTMTIALYLGYRHFDLFGCDSSYPDNSSTHVNGYETPYSDKDGVPVCVTYNGETAHFKVLPYLGLQVEEFKEYCERNHRLFSCRVWGDSLLKWLHSRMYPSQYEGING